ncbi:hypothetical protein NDI56_01135 [Haloarcula sp. S1CR25-12]|uniref:Ig-like domain-containing protein n=1 Tax=Haloarcula saliterrae TaxID=2950534 RepID=A0ABU2F8F4_9EURY|nr:hypothetical protein [Haloarcula sp. S1CR25-12]MDS0258006.1 hypothetical protein [Haloarcula sp. S1CR25-12]
MRRRTYLCGLALSTLPLSGCAGDSSSSPPTVTPDPDDPVLFVVTNQQGAAATVQLTLALDDGATVLDESVTLDAGASREYDPGIDRPGQYELTAAIENGLQRTLTLNIGSGDIRTGSNYDVILRDNGVQVTWEE